MGPQTETAATGHPLQVRVEVTQVHVSPSQEGGQARAHVEAVDGHEEGEAGQLQPLQPPLQAHLQLLPTSPEIGQAQAGHTTEGGGEGGRLQGRGQSDVAEHRLSLSDNYAYLDTSIRTILGGLFLK